jgi:serine/threonine protein phosphatase PrpC
VSALPRIAEDSAETLRLAVAATSDAAGRAENQDVAVAMAVARAPTSDAGDEFLLLVADGMGGHPSGDLASRIAADTLIDAFATLPQGDLGLALKQAYRQANEAVFTAGERDAAHAGMGTTLTTALLRGKYATIANVGDSRAYLLRGDRLTQVTRDDTLVANEVAQGRITATAARQDPRRNVLTHAIGTQPKLESRLPSIFELTLLPGDRLLLVSDGLYGVLDDRDMEKELVGEDPSRAADTLVALARQRGTSDNASAVVAAAIPTRVPVVTLQPAATDRTGGLPGTVIIAAVAVLLVVLLLIAVFVLGVAP